MLDPELRLLRYFVVVAEERHFARAAERLGIAQPPLSQQIRKLETQLGAQLIDRSRRPIELTDAGRALLAEGRLALAHGERGFAAARRAAAGELGVLRVGAMQAALNGIVPDVVRAYRRERPDVRLELVEEGTAGQIAELLEGRLDAGFVRGPIDEPAIAVETLIDDPLVAAVPDEHPLAQKNNINPVSLATEPLVMWARTAAPTTYADVVQLFREHHIQPPVAEESTRIQTVLALVAAGAGVALLPASFANLHRRNVSFRPLRGPLPHRPLALAWRAGETSPTLSSLLLITRRVAPQYANQLQTAPRRAKPRSAIAPKTKRSAASRRSRNSASDSRSSTR
jgi:DNA-binding transcriptional LysR family regulator